MIVPSIFLSAVFEFATFGATSAGGIVVVSLLYGFTAGAYVSLIAPLLSLITPDLRELGLARTSMLLQLISGLTTTVKDPARFCVLGGRHSDVDRRAHPWCAPRIGFCVVEANRVQWGALDNSAARFVLMLGGV
jgi:hypothetical protein